MRTADFSRTQTTFNVCKWPKADRPLMNDDYESDGGSQPYLSATATHRRSGSQSSTGSVTPQRDHPIADIVPDEELDSRMERIAAVMASCAPRMPMHQEFIDRHCRAERIA